MPTEKGPPQKQFSGIHRRWLLGVTCKSSLISLKFDGSASRNNRTKPYRNMFKPLGILLCRWMWMNWNAACKQGTCLGALSNIGKLVFSTVDGKDMKDVQSGLRKREVLGSDKWSPCRL